MIHQMIYQILLCLLSNEVLNEAQPSAVEDVPITPLDVIETIVRQGIKLRLVRVL